VVVVDFLQLKALEVLIFLHPHSLHELLFDLQAQLLLLGQLRLALALLSEVPRVVNGHHLLPVFDEHVGLVVDEAGNGFQVPIEDCYVHWRVPFDVLQVQMPLDSMLVVPVLHLVLHEVLVEVQGHLLDVFLGLDPALSLLLGGRHQTHHVPVVLALTVEPLHLDDVMTDNYLQPVLLVLLLLDLLRNELPVHVLL